MSIVSLFTFSSLFNDKILSNGVRYRHRPTNIDVAWRRRIDVVMTLPRGCDLVGWHFFLIFNMLNISCFFIFILTKCQISCKCDSSPFLLQFCYIHVTFYMFFQGDGLYKPQCFWPNPIPCTLYITHLCNFSNKYCLNQRKWKFVPTIFLHLTGNF